MTRERDDFERGKEIGIRLSKVLLSGGYNQKGARRFAMVWAYGVARGMGLSVEEATAEFRRYATEANIMLEDGILRGLGS